MKTLFIALSSFGFGIYLLYSSYVAVKSGVARYRRFRYSREATPGNYWFFVIYTGFVGLAACAMAVIVLLYVP